MGKFVGFKVSKSRGREGKLGRKSRQEKEEETWKHENPLLFGGGFSWPISTSK